MKTKKPAESTPRYWQYHYRADEESINMQSAIIEHLSNCINSEVNGGLSAIRKISHSEAIRFAIRYTYENLGLGKKQ